MKLVRVSELEIGSLVDAEPIIEDFGGSTSDRFIVGYELSMVADLLPDEYGGYTVVFDNISDYYLPGWYRVFVKKGEA